MLPAKPQLSELNALILKLWVPAVLNFLLIPLVGAADVFWVGRMGDTVALAAQGAADRVFSSAFWTISFLPSLVTPLVAKAAATGDRGAMQKQIGEAMFVAVLMGMLGMTLMMTFPQTVLGIAGISPGTRVYDYAQPYVWVRALTFIPAIIATVGFSAFRGTMDVMTPLKITVCCQLLNICLDPLFIFGWGPIGALGVAGAALATAGAELISFCAYITYMFRRQLLTLTSLIRVPKVKDLLPLFRGGLAVQLRSLALNLGLLSITRATITMDPAGTMAAAHTITVNLWQLAGVVLLALSSVATILIPQVLNSQKGSRGLLAAKKAGDRLLLWGLVVGLLLGVMQALATPMLGLFTTVPEVQAAARIPTIIAASQQGLNGVAFVAEGMMQGHQAFAQLALNTVVACIGLMLSLDLGMNQSLVGVWGCFWVFNGIRAAGALFHHFWAGPLAPRNLRKAGIDI